MPQLCRKGGNKYSDNSSGLYNGYFEKFLVGGGVLINYDRRKIRGASRGWGVRNIIILIFYLIQDKNGYEYIIRGINSFNVAESFNAALLH